MLNYFTKPHKELFKTNKYSLIVDINTGNIYIFGCTELYNKIIEIDPNKHLNL